MEKFTDLNNVRKLVILSGITVSCTVCNKDICILDALVENDKVYCKNCHAKPCPFCGCTIIKNAKDQSKYDYYYCDSCGARSCKFDNNLHKALLSWNRRLCSSTSPETAMAVEISDAFDGTAKYSVKITKTDSGIFLTPEGYGDYCSKDGEGKPVLLEVFAGIPRIVMWSDINKEDYTHLVELNNAEEKLRKND